MYHQKYTPDYDKQDRNIFLCQLYIHHDKDTFDIHKRRLQYMGITTHTNKTRLNNDKYVDRASHPTMRRPLTVMKDVNSARV